MAEFASRATGNTALGLSIGALGLEAVRGGVGNLLNGILGGGNNTNEALLTAALMAGVAGSRGGDCERGYGRYDAGKDAEIAELRTEIKLRDANTYTDQKLLEVYAHIDRRLEGVNRRLCEQDVWNTAQTGAMNCMAQQIAALNGLTKLVIPNTSICPGWGNVTVTPATTTTGA